MISSKKKRPAIQDAYFDFPIFTFFMRLSAIGEKKMHKNMERMTADTFRLPSICAAAH